MGTTLIPLRAEQVPDPTLTPSSSPICTPLQPNAGQDHTKSLSQAGKAPPTLINSHGLSFYFKHHPVI